MQNIFKQFEKALGILNTVEDVETDLYNKQSEYDNKIQFWLHFLENNKILYLFPSQKTLT